MAPNKSPAFQFYPKDFIAGTATMSLQEVGAYMRLLCYAWDTGSVPAEGDERARIMVCSKAQERELWKKVGKKFVLSDDVYLNERMEVERKKQSEYRRRQSDAGRASAASRHQPEGNHGSTTVQPRLDSGSNQKATLLSSSSSSEKDPNTHTPRANGHGRGANAPGALPRDHRFHALCGKRLRLCLTDTTAAKFAGKWGGVADDAMPVLQRFIDALEVQIGDGPKGDALWLEQHFEAFMHENGRSPIPAVKPKANGAASVIDQIEKWGRE